MATVVIRHKAGNLDAWLKGHQDRVALFAPAVTGFKTFQDTDDPKSVVLAVDVIDLEKLGAIIRDPKTSILKTAILYWTPITMSMPVEL